LTHQDKSTLVFVYIVSKKKGKSDRKSHYKEPYKNQKGF
jgi:hypothetical protein